MLGLKEFYGLGAARLSGARVALVSENVITVGKLVCWLVPRAVVRVGRVRLSELPAVEVCRRVAAPRRTVWALVSDITRVCAWGGECVHAEWIDGADGPVVGARFRGRQVRRGREWTSVSVVIEALPGVSFAWVVGDPQCASATWRYQLALDGSGDTILRYRAVMGPGPSGLSDAIAQAPEREESIIAFRLAEHKRNMMATLESIKQAAEQ